MASWASPPSSVPTAQPTATWTALNPMAQSKAPQRIATRLNMAGESAGVEKRSSAFSIPMATAANETRGRNGIMTRVRRTVSSVLPGTSPKPGASRATRGSAKTMPNTTSTPRIAVSRVNSRDTRR